MRVVEFYLLFELSSREVEGCICLNEIKMLENKEANNQLKPRKHCHSVSEAKL